MNNVLCSVLNTDEEYVSKLNSNEITSNPYMEHVKTAVYNVEI
jgi:hypothetical protein